MAQRDILMLLVVASTVACSLITSLDDLNATSDASIDAAGDVSDTGLREAEAGPFCASLSPQPTFCDDFDEGYPAPAAPWTSNAESGDASLVGIVDDAASTSPPSSVFFNTLNVTSTDSAETVFIKNGLNVTKSLEMAFDIRLDVLDPTKNNWFIEIGIGTPPYFVFVRFNPNNDAVEDNGPTNDAGMSTAIATNFSQAVLAGVWSHVDVLVDVQNAQLSASKNGVVVVPPRAMVADHATGGAAYVNLGIGYVGGPATPMAVHYDNIVIDVK